MGAWSEMNQRKRLMANWISRVPPLTITLIRPTWETTDAGGRVQTGTTTPRSAGLWLYAVQASSYDRASSRAL